ncbi:MAG: group III truncated hemoglobin [Bacteroidia bacterium]|nr:group III truncated hemoglobin [Bacteroidia bacterium]
MKKTIESREDIELLVKIFYEKVFADSEIGYFFTEVAKVNPETHFPKITDFWEGILFQNPVYRGNPMHAHIQLNEKEALKPEHFERWLSIFHATVEEMFEGERAEKAKQSAISIATLIQVKIHQRKFPIMT